MSSSCGGVSLLSVVAIDDTGKLEFNSAARRTTMEVVEIVAVIEGTVEEATTDGKEVPEDMLDEVGPEVEGTALAVVVTNVSRSLVEISKLNVIEVVMILLILTVSFPTRVVALKLLESRYRSKG